MGWTYTGNWKRVTTGSGAGSGSLLGVTAGSLVVVAVRHLNTISPPALDYALTEVGQGLGALTKVFYSKEPSLSEINAGIFFLPPSANLGGNLSFNATITPAFGVSTITAAEFTGVDTSTPSGGTPSTNGGPGATTPTSGSMSYVADSLVMAIVAKSFGDGITENAGGEGFTLIEEEEGFTHVSGSLVYKIISGAAGSQAETWTFPNGDSYAAGIAAFKPSSGPGAAPAFSSAPQSTLFKLKGYRGYGSW